MADTGKCSHPDLSFSAGEEEEPEGDYINARTRVRAWANESCPDCGYDRTFYGAWKTK